VLLRAAWTVEIAPELAVFDGLPKIRAWHAAAVEIEAVKRSAVPDLREQYQAYLGDRADCWVGSKLGSA
jgi:glutathione S-transferase